MATEWVKRWRRWMARVPSRPGIYRLRDGGWLVRARITDPATQRRKAVEQTLSEGTVVDAQRVLDGLKEEKRLVVRGKVPSKQLFADFAVSLFQAKVAAGDIRSAKGAKHWQGVLERVLVPEFGHIACNVLAPYHLAKWREKLAGWIANGRSWERRLRSGKTETRTGAFAPNTANGWFRILRVISRAMLEQLDLPRDPSISLKDFGLTQHPTYTDEEPNALTAELTTRFLETMRARHPQHHAMALLGFATGNRPSTLRPLRRQGPESDIDWDVGFVRFRRSHTLGERAMLGTKTGTQERVHLPPSVMTTLREHAASLADPPLDEKGKPPTWWRPKMRKSDLLFPARTGRMRSSSSLDKPFRDTAKAAGIPYPVTPRAMRRTFQDLMRQAKVHDVVVRSISGHQTEEMQIKYSTAEAEEQRTAIAAVVDLMTFREARKEAKGA